MWVFVRLKLILNGIVGFVSAKGPESETNPGSRG